jgi:hypothetical protein
MVSRSPECRTPALACFSMQRIQQRRLKQESAERRAQTCAAGVRCLETWRPSEAEVKEAQMCALVNFGEHMPRPMAVTLATAIHKARHDAGRWISAGDCLVRIAQHFVSVWGPRLNQQFPRRP